MIKFLLIAAARPSALLAAACKPYRRRRITAPLLYGGGAKGATITTNGKIGLGAVMCCKTDETPLRAVHPV